MSLEKTKEKRKRVRIHVIRMGEIVYKTDSKLNFRKTFSQQMVLYKDLNFSIVQKINGIRPQLANRNVNI